MCRSGQDNILQCAIAIEASKVSYLELVLSVANGRFSDKGPKAGARVPIQGLAILIMAQDQLDRLDRTVMEYLTKVTLVFYYSVSSL